MDVRRNAASRRRDVTWRPVDRRGKGRPGRVDAVAVEEPLEIRVDGETAAITMRTPGRDRELALGFLLGEGVVRSLDQVGSIAVCDRPGTNVVEVRAAPGECLDIDRVLDSRRFVTSSACGVCGRRSIQELLDRCAANLNGCSTSIEHLDAAMAALRRGQAAFELTGGLHAAGAFTSEAVPLAIEEDVGRHNAVDKVVGRLLLGHTLERAQILAVSGRASFEIVQKAAAAGIPLVASVSAASSLAIDLAEARGITLAAFVRGRSLNIYSHPNRLR